MMIVKVNLIFPSPFTWENVLAGLNGKSAKQRELTLTRYWKEKQRPLEGISQGRKQRGKEKKNRKPKEIEKKRGKKEKGKDSRTLVILMLLFFFIGDNSILGVTELGRENT